MAAKKARIGTSSKDKRRDQFKRAYLAEGKNAKAAAIKLGYSPRSAHVTGSRLLKEVKHEIEEIEVEQVKRLQLNADDFLIELKRLALFDIRKLYNDDGTLKAIKELDDDTAAALSSVDTEEVFDGRGEERSFVGYSKKVKAYDKNTALLNMLKHLGMFEKDNNQRGDSLAIQINLTK